MCQQTAGLAARVIEEAGIPTVMLTLVREVAELVNAPRSLYVRHPFGSPVGRPGEADKQLDVLRKAIALLQSADRGGTILDSGLHY